MKVKEITVSCGTTFNHPYEQYANYRPSVTLTAQVSEGVDDVSGCVMRLSSQAQFLVDCQKEAILLILKQQRDDTQAEFRRKRELEEKARQEIAARKAEQRKDTDGESDEDRDPDFDEIPDF